LIENQCLKKLNRSDHAIRVLEMVKPKLKQLTLLTASIVVAGLFLVQPARALTATAQPYRVTSWESVEAAQPIGQRRCYTYRNGRRFLPAMCAPWRP
jgi:hypothetical protein